MTVLLVLTNHSKASDTPCNPSARGAALKAMVIGLGIVLVTVEAAAHPSHGIEQLL